MCCFHNDVLTLDLGFKIKILIYILVSTQVEPNIYQFCCNFEVGFYDQQFYLH